MRTYYEVYDKVLEEIQQLRLDANHFSKITSRIDREMARARAKCKNYEERLVRRPSERCLSKIARCHAQVKRLISRSMSATLAFRNVVRDIRDKCGKYCEVAGKELTFDASATASINCVVRLDEIGDLGKLYCKCNQPAYGSMIACDMPDCKTGWYHFECVGLMSQPPKAPWVCQDCKKRDVLAA
jgi:inhibitor of growth protein 4